MSAGLAASTDTPGSTAPELSLTVPAIEAPLTACARAAAGSSNTSTASIDASRFRNVIRCVPPLNKVKDHRRLQKRKSRKEPPASGAKRIRIRRNGYRPVLVAGEDVPRKFVVVRWGESQEDPREPCRHVEAADRRRAPRHEHVPCRDIGAVPRAERRVHLRGQRAADKAQVAGRAAGADHSGHAAGL